MPATRNVKVVVHEGANTRIVDLGQVGANGTTVDISAANGKKN